MTKIKHNELEQTCIKSINEICECRKTCRQTALKFVCQVTVLAVKRKASTPASIDKLLKELFTKARRKLSPDLKTRYRQTVLYLFFKKGAWNRARAVGTMPQAELDFLSEIGGRLHKPNKKGSSCDIGQVCKGKKHKLCQQVLRKFEKGAANGRKIDGGHL